GVVEVVVVADDVDRRVGHALVGRAAVVAARPFAHARRGEVVDGRVELATALAVAGVARGLGHAPAPAGARTGHAAAPRPATTGEAAAAGAARAATRQVAASRAALAPADAV